MTSTTNDCCAKTCKLIMEGELENYIRQCQCNIQVDDDFPAPAPNPEATIPYAVPVDDATNPYAAPFADVSVTPPSSSTTATESTSEGSKAKEALLEDDLRGSSIFKKRVSKLTSSISRALANLRSVIVPRLDHRMNRELQEEVLRDLQKKVSLFKAQMKYKRYCWTYIWKSECITERNNLRALESAVVAATAAVNRSDFSRDVEARAAAIYKNSLTILRTFGIALISVVAVYASFQYGLLRAATFGVSTVSSSITAAYTSTPYKKIFAASFLALLQGLRLVYGKLTNTFLSTLGKKSRQLNARVFKNHMTLLGLTALPSIALIGKQVLYNGLEEYDFTVLVPLDCKGQPVDGEFIVGSATDIDGSPLSPGDVIVDPIGSEFLVVALLTQNDINNRTSVYRAFFPSR